MKEAPLYRVLCFLSIGNNFVKFGTLLTVRMITFFNAAMHYLLLYLQQMSSLLTNLVSCRPGQAGVVVATWATRCFWLEAAIKYFQFAIEYTSVDRVLGVWLGSWVWLGAGRCTIKPLNKVHIWTDCFIFTLNFR